MESARISHCFPFFPFLFKTPPKNTSKPQAKLQDLELSTRKKLQEWSFGRRKSHVTQLWKKRGHEISTIFLGGEEDDDEIFATTVSFDGICQENTDFSGDFRRSRKERNLVSPLQLQFSESKYDSPRVFRTIPTRLKLCNRSGCHQKLLGMKLGYQELWRTMIKNWVIFGTISVKIMQPAIPNKTIGKMEFLQPFPLVCYCKSGVMSHYSFVVVVLRVPFPLVHKVWVGVLL